MSPQLEEKKASWSEEDANYIQGQIIKIDSVPGGLVMRVLLFLADMLRGDLVNIEEGVSPFERTLGHLGGTWWPNAFTPAPDTPRGTASLFSGCYPSTHGVNMRSKSCLESFQDTKPSLLKALADAGVEVAVFRSEKEIQEGIWLPQDCLTSISQFSDLENLSRWARDKEDIFIYWHDNIYHNASDVSNLVSDPHEVGLDGLKVSLERALGFLEFDFVWLVSDHGCKFPGESFSPESMIDRSRTNIFFFLHEKTMPNRVLRDDSLRGIFDLYPSVLRQFGLGCSNEEIAGIDIQTRGGHDGLGIEDWSSLNPADRELPDLFGIRLQDSLVTFHNNRARVFDDSTGESVAIPEATFFEIAEKVGAKFAFLSDVNQIVRNRQKIEAVAGRTFPLEMTDPLLTIFGGLGKKFSMLKLFVKLGLVVRVPARRLASVLQLLSTRIR